jgi:hypothetical protein
MRYPPSLRFELRASRIYRAVACLVAIFIIANYLYSASGNLQFSLKNLVLGLCSACAALWLVCDAWKRPKGSLHYAQGQWHWLDENQEIRGTCALHLDLQSYMLVSFSAQSAKLRFFQTTTQWFHLEARHAHHAASPAHAEAWLALRRAVYSPMEPADEAVAV